MFKIDPKTLIVIAAGLAAGFITANIALNNLDEQEVLQLGELPDTKTSVTHLPEINLPDILGDKRNITEWYGKPLIVNFWATWCAPCLREMPLLQLTHETAGEDGPLVIGIAADRTEDVKSFIAEYGYTYPILIGQQEAFDLAEQFGFDFLGLPITIFTTADGEILRIHTGELHAEQLEAYLEIYMHLGMGHMHIDVARERMEAI